MNKVALIIGATGMTGSQLLQLLINSQKYDKVVSFVRKSSGLNNSKLTEHVINFDNTESYADLVKGDDFFCCLGTTIKKAGSQEAFEKVDLYYPIHFAKVAEKNGVKKYLLISSMGANHLSKNFYLRTKGRCEQKLKTLSFVSTSMFHTSLLLGNRVEWRWGEKIGEYAMKLLSFILVGSWKKYRAIDSSKVAFAMYHIAQQNTTGFQVYESDQIAEIGTK